MSIVDDFRFAFRKPNNGLIQLILINVVVFLALLLAYLTFFLIQSDGYALVTSWLALPPLAGAFLLKPWTLVTYFFTHLDPFHILFNMLSLYWFGKLIEEYLGNKHVLSLYFMGGIAGGVLYLLLSNLVPVFYQMAAFSPGMIGSSGAVYAIIIGAATLMPNYTFFVFLLGPVRIKYIAAFVVVVSLFYVSRGANSGGNIAHLGGALMGFIFITQLKKGNDLATPFRNLGQQVGKLFQRKPKMRVTYRNQGNTPPSGASSATFPSEDEIDRILDKINRSGYESLTKEEKQKLFHASQKN
jgi:membrane associated rhomboid family serine protease